MESLTRCDQQSHSIQPLFDKTKSNIGANLVKAPKIYFDKRFRPPAKGKFCPNSRRNLPRTVILTCSDK